MSDAVPESLREVWSWKARADAALERVPRADREALLHQQADDVQRQFAVELPLETPARRAAVDAPKST